MSGYVMRPARRDDLAALTELAELSGPGFTSLPVDEALLASRLEKSEKSFRGDIPQPEYGKYLLMMEDTANGAVLGCSAVKAGVGIDYPFFNYRIITLAQASAAGDRRFDMDALVLTNEFVGYTEVGTLFLKPETRGTGAGRLAAQSRYLLMAAAPDRFGHSVLAELRGVVDDTGQTPFWDCLGRHFFRMEFAEADHLSAVSDNQFILDLMPKYPVYVDLLPPEAREVIGRCHAEGVGALKLLEWEGFRFERVVDIFDGGPLVSARQDVIRTIRESCLVRLEPGEVEAEGVQVLVSSDQLLDFKVTLGHGVLKDDQTLIVEEDLLHRIERNPGDQARAWLRS